VQAGEFDVRLDGFGVPAVELKVRAGKFDVQGGLFGVRANEFDV
jgi:hypothetical protein